MTHKIHVAWHSCNIVIRWPCLTWPCSWPLLCIKLILMCHLLYPLGSLLTKVGLASVIYPFLVAVEAKSVNSDHHRTLPDLWPFKFSFLYSLKCLVTFVPSLQARHVRVEAPSLCRSTGSVYSSQLWCFLSNPWPYAYEAKRCNECTAMFSCIKWEFLSKKINHNF